MPRHPPLDSQLATKWADTYPKIAEIDQPRLRGQEETADDFWEEFLKQTAPSDAEDGERRPYGAESTPEGSSHKAVKRDSQPIESAVLEDLQGYMMDHYGDLPASFDVVKALGDVIINPSTFNEHSYLSTSVAQTDQGSIDIAAPPTNSGRSTPTRHPTAHSLRHKDLLNAAVRANGFGLTSIVTTGHTEATKESLRSRVAGFLAKRKRKETHKGRTIEYPKSSPSKPNTDSKCAIPAGW